MLLLNACVTTEHGSLAANADPKKAEAAYVQLGLGYLQSGNRDASKVNFENALKINSRSAGANEGMARLYQIDAENELAEKHFKLALRYDSSFSRARNNFGSFLYQQQRYEEAYDQFELAAKDVGYDSRAVALVNLGRTALKLDRRDRARASFEHALSLQPNLSMAIVELADITYQLGEYAQSKKYLDRQAELARQTPRTLWLGIRLERKFGNRDKEMSYALQLKNLYGYSQEYLDYQEWLASNID
jgi:type IV pilus assembly protein PilF